MARPNILSSSLPYVLKINGKDAGDFGLQIYSIPQLGMPALEWAQQAFPDTHGSYAFEGYYTPRTLTITGAIVADSASQLRTNIDALKSALSKSIGGHYGATASVLKIQLADLTDRYYAVEYAGSMSITPTAQRPTNEHSAFVTIPLMQTYPFALANEATAVAPTGTGASFQTLDLGTAPCHMTVDLQGASTAPDFVVADHAFHADLNWSLNFTNIQGTTGTGTSGASNLADQFEPSDHGGRYIQTGSFTTSFSGVVNNPSEQTWVVVGRPAFDYTAGDQVILEHYIDANNYTRLFWDNSDVKFGLLKVIGGSGTTLLMDSASAHGSDDYKTLAVSFGADGMKIYIDGVLSNSNATTTGVTGSSGTLYFGDQGATLRPSFKYDYVFGYPFQHDNDDVIRIMTNPDAVKPYNTKKSKSTNISANAHVVLDFEKRTVKAYASNGTQTNDRANWDTGRFPILRPPKMCFHVPSGETINGIKVLYRKAYL